eukprot:749583-Hanusia_phi.AAC.2
MAASSSRSSFHGIPTAPKSLPLLGDRTWAEVMEKGGGGETRIGRQGLGTWEGAEEGGRGSRTTGSTP